MSFDKAIQHGKEKRKPWRKSKAWDHTCRNHGSCGWCEGTRAHNSKRKMAETEFDCDNCFDTGCICGGLGVTCSGCCDCVYDE